MKALSTLASLICLLLPAAALAGNAQPALYLEAYASEDIPTNPAPSYICTHGEQVGGTYHCFAPKAPLGFLYLVLHVDKLDEGSQGGFVGLPFGIATSGEAVVFTCVFPCPGFSIGPSTAGWPSAIVVASMGEDQGGGCRDRLDNPCYLGYFNSSSRTGATYFDIVGNADTEGRNVINCQFQYDPGTVVGCNAQWGGEQATPCLALVPVRNTTWGAIKSLYR